MQAGLMVAAGAATVTTLSIVADRRRQSRHDLDRVGLVPWTSITVIGVMVTLFGIAFSLKGPGI